MTDKINNDSNINTSKMCNNFIPYNFVSYIFMPCYLVRHFERALVWLFTDRDCQSG